jgi:Flp pilus assembly protein TadB
MNEPGTGRRYDRNVSPNWKPVAGLEPRKAGMTWSDRLWYWLVSLGGLAMIAAGVLWATFLPFKRFSFCLIGLGLVVFVLGSPSRAVRNGYRD